MNKKLRLFNKRHLYILDLAQTAKLLVITKQLIRKNFVCFPLTTDGVCLTTGVWAVYVMTVITLTTGCPGFPVLSVLGRV